MFGIARARGVINGMAQAIDVDIRGNDSRVRLHRDSAVGSHWGARHIGVLTVVRKATIGKLLFQCSRNQVIETQDAGGKADLWIGIVP